MTFAKKTFLLLFLAAHPAIIVFSWLQGNRDLMALGGFSSLYALGRLTGLLLVFQVLLQMFFIGRVGWAERLFGLDRLVYVHKWNGFLALIFLFLHPLLLVFGAAGNRGVGFASQFFEFFALENVPFAVAAFFVFSTVIAFTLWAILRKTKYETWYLVHLMMYAAILLAFGHQLEIGADLTGNILFRGYWLFLYAFFGGAFLVFRFWKPLRAFMRHRFFLEKVVPECNNVFSFYISGEHMERFSVKGGQFLMLRFLAPGLMWQSHPFSVSMPPNGNGLRVTVKTLGDFTSTMKDIPPKTRIIIDGPHGLFTASGATKKKLLCIAGGIGITPIRSVAEEALRAGREVVLVFCANTRDDFAFRGEFSELAAEFGQSFKAFYLASKEPEGWLASLEQGRSGRGETGILDEEKLYHLVPDFAEREVYVCGPAQLLKMSRGILHKTGVKRKFIHFERFKLL